MWKVIGYEEQTNDEGDVTAITMYAVKDMREKQGVGKKARRVWYRTNEIDYRPAIDEVVFIETETRGKYEVVTDIYPV